MSFAQKSTTQIWGFIAFLMLMIIALPASGHAADVSIRTGEHDKYSRIVLEWNTSFTYTLKKSGETQLLLGFNKAAKTDLSGVSSAENTNLQNIKVTASSPLSLSLTIPNGARHRVLKAGRKLIVDVYSPASGKPRKMGQTSTPKTSTPKKQDTPPTKEAKPSPQDNLGQAMNAEFSKAKTALTSSAHVDIVPQGHAQKQRKLAPIAPLKKLEALTDTNMITVSATKSIGMAVFENDGYLWLAVDKGDLFIRPQAAGSKAKELSQTEKVKIKDGQAFRIKLPGQSTISTDGAGLLWRIKLSPPREKNTARSSVKPAIPKNITDGDGHGGGTVFWPLRGARSIMDIADPRTGEILKVVSVRKSRSFSGPARSFSEFDVLPSYAGMTIRPKVDDLQIKIIPGGVEITRPHGLHILPQELISTAIPHKKKDEERGDEEENRTILPFSEWEMGGAEALSDNRSKILALLPEMSEGEKLEKLITLGKMHLANGLGAEALGFFNFAYRELPELTQNPRFLAMRGVAKLISWKTEDGYNDLLACGLDQYDDVAYWKAYALADLSDWTQAGEVLPQNIKPIENYPDPIRNRLALGLAEVALRAGNLDQAQELLDLVDKDIKNLNVSETAALKYLKGEAARQKGNTDITYQYWDELINGDDDLYRAKAGLAETRLKIEEHKLDPEKAIDTLERLRYSWRGDELETQINYWLGRTYFEGDNFLKGLRIMRDSAAIAPTPEYGRNILAEMGEVFSNLYLGDKLSTIKPLDAVALYEQFSELLPTGKRGDQIIARLSSYLVKANLLTRAASLLEHQIDHRLSDEEAVRVGVKLASIRMLDDDPERTLKTLKVVERKLGAGSPPDYPREQALHDIKMLRIQALSAEGKPDPALKLLESMDATPEVNRLRANVAWNARYWDEAADALKAVIADEKISLTRPLTPEQATLILNRAIALNLDGDRIAISNIREKYSALMAQTDKSRIFEVVTRHRQNAKLADRETLLSSISEVDLFKDFMDSYRKTLAAEE